MWRTPAATIVREYWNGVAGTTVANIPTGNAPTGTDDPHLAGSADRFRRRLRRAHPRLHHRADDRQLLLLDRRQQRGGTLDLQRRRAGQRLQAGLGDHGQRARRRRGTARRTRSRRGSRWSRARSITSRSCTRRASAAGDNLAVGWLEARPDRHRAERGRARLRALALCRARSRLDAGHALRRDDALAERRRSPTASAPRRCG